MLRDIEAKIEAIRIALERVQSAEGVVANALSQADAAYGYVSRRRQAVVELFFLEDDVTRTAAQLEVAYGYISARRRAEAELRILDEEAAVEAAAARARLAEARAREARGRPHTSLNPERTMETCYYNRLNTRDRPLRRMWFLYHGTKWENLNRLVESGWMRPQRQLNPEYEMALLASEIRVHFFAVWHLRCFKYAKKYPYPIGYSADFVPVLKVSVNKLLGQEDYAVFLLSDRISTEARGGKRLVKFVIATRVPGTTPATEWQCPATQLEKQAQAQSNGIYNTRLLGNIGPGYTISPPEGDASSSTDSLEGRTGYFAEPIELAYAAQSMPNDVVFRLKYNPGRDPVSVYGRWEMWVPYIDDARGNYCDVQVALAKRTDFPDLKMSIFEGEGRLPPHDPLSQHRWLHPRDYNWLGPSGGVRDFASVNTSGATPWTRGLSAKGYTEVWPHDSRGEAEGGVLYDGPRPASVARRPPPRTTHISQTPAVEAAAGVSSSGESSSGESSQSQPQSPSDPGPSDPSWRRRRMRRSDPWWD